MLLHMYYDLTGAWFLNRTVGEVTDKNRPSLNFGKDKLLARMISRFILCSYSSFLIKDLMARYVWFNVHNFPWQVTVLTERSRWETKYGILKGCPCDCYPQFLPYNNKWAPQRIIFITTSSPIGFHQNSKTFHRMESCLVWLHGLGSSFVR